VQTINANYLYSYYKILVVWLLNRDSTPCVHLHDVVWYVCTNT